MADDRGYTEYRDKPKKEYGLKEYHEDNQAFQPESIHYGNKPEISPRAFKAQERMNKHPELGVKYEKLKKEHPERFGLTRPK